MSSNGKHKPITQAERLIMVADLKKDSDEMEKQGNHKAAMTLAFRATELELKVGEGPFKKKENVNA